MIDNRNRQRKRLLFQTHCMKMHRYENKKEIYQQKCPAGKKTASMNRHKSFIFSDFAGIWNCITLYVKILCRNFMNFKLFFCEFSLIFSRRLVTSLFSGFTRFFVNGFTWRGRFRPWIGAGVGRRDDANSASGGTAGTFLIKGGSHLPLTTKLSRGSVNTKCYDLIYKNAADLPLVDFTLARLQNRTTVEIVAVLIVIAEIFHGNGQTAVTLKFYINISAHHQKGTLTGVWRDFVFFAHVNTSCYDIFAPCPGNWT